MKKRWWFLLLVAAVLAVLGLTWGSWSGALLGLLDQEGARIRTLNALAALVGVVAALTTGAWDMSGNVLEWTRSEKEGSGVVPLPGGGFVFDERFARCAARIWNIVDFFNSNVGFRVVLSLADSES